MRRTGRQTALWVVCAAHDVKSIAMHGKFRHWARDARRRRRRRNADIRGVWDGDLGRGEETLFRQSEIFPGNLLTNSGKSCIIYSLSIGGWMTLPIGKMRGWRNWQTRTFEGRVVHTIRVRFPFLAPPFHGARVS